MCFPLYVDRKVVERGKKFHCDLVKHLRKFRLTSDNKINQSQVKSDEVCR